MSGVVLAGVSFLGLAIFPDPRGLRRPLPALLSLMYFRLLTRIREMAVREWWAEAH